MKRSSYIGSAGVIGGGALGGIPTQAEAAAYFASLSVSPSDAFRAAVNLAIYELKELGVWANAIHLGTFCGANSADSLKSLHGTNHATLTGAPTHTPYKGFSAFSATKGINFTGSTQANLGGSGGYPVILAAMKAVNLGGAGASLTESANGLPSIGYEPGAFHMDGNGLKVSRSTWPSFKAISAPQGYVVGGKYSTNLYPGYSGVGPVDASVTVSGDLKTALHADTGTALPLMSAYWIFNESVSDAQGGKICLILSNLINQIGALD